MKITDVEKEGFVLDDSQLFIPFLSNICGRCKHFRPLQSSVEVKKCEAFDEIPMEIWCGGHDHKTPYPGDKGIMFEKFVIGGD